MKKIEPIYKIVVLSIDYCGKTSFITRYLDNIYDGNNLTTYGVDFKTKTHLLKNGTKIKVQIWDTASGERNMSFNRIFIKNAKGIIILYDISKRASFDDAKYYLREIKEYPINDNVIALVGNKLDLDNNDYISYQTREITTEEGQNFANENNLLFFEVSAKNGTNVDKCFNDLIERIYEKEQNNNNESGIIIENKIKSKRPAKRGCLK